MECQKHAYLLATHHYSKVLEILVRMIDDERNDIYVHIDKKVKASYANAISSIVKKANLFFVKRKKVYWGHFSVVKAEYSLFQTAFENGPYAYYHLLSGNDLPIKSQDEIHDFFNLHQGKEFVSFSKDSMQERVQYKWLFPPRGMCSDSMWIGRKVNVLLEKLSKWFVYLQRKVGYKNNAFPIYKKGSNWVSLTNQAVEMLLENKHRVFRGFRCTNYPDEYYKQTVMYNLMKDQCKSLQFYLYRDEKGITYPSDVRLIDWKRGLPYCFTINDFNEIEHSSAMFCRKIFDEDLAVKLYKRFCD